MERGPVEPGPGLGQDRAIGGLDLPGIAEGRDEEGRELRIAAGDGGIVAGLVRFSAGLEHADDVVGDLLAALAAV